jgi:hypothetical protein
VAQVQVNDLLPAGVTFQSYQASQGAYDHTSGLWEIGTLANKANATLTLVARVKNNQEGKAIINTATITSKIQFTDPNVLNNTATVTIIPVAAPAPPESSIYLPIIHKN